MPKDPLKSPELYINRELSWLEFNHRVLAEGLSEDLPLFERLKFLAIVSSNLDEFFLVRVAGLMRQREAKVRKRDPSGMTPGEQLRAIVRRVHRMYDEQAAGIRGVLGQLANHGLFVWSRGEWSPEQRQYLKSYFAREIMPLLTPMALEDLKPRPLLPTLQMHVAALVIPPEGESETQRGQSHFHGDNANVQANAEIAAKIGTVPGEKFVVVPVPAQLSRFIALPAEKETHLAWLEDAIAANLPLLFPGCEVLAAAAFRIARDADVILHDEEVEDLLHAVEKAVLSRRRRAAVCLQIAADADPRIKRWLMDWTRLGEESVYEQERLNAASLMELAARKGFDELQAEDWPPQPPRDLLGADDLWEAIRDRDILLFHPYESFQPVVRLVEEAADDPQVLAIKQTLYRTSGDSPIVRALGRAAQNGKEVTALVELKARFDETRNIGWARRLEDAGVHVIYGIAGFKTHAKALLIVRREEQHIQRYVHLATGNYNDRTARMYSDFGLMTCDRDVAADVAAFFNLLTGYSEQVGWSKLSIAPTGLRQKFLDLIEREIQVSTPDRPGLIMAKCNSLQDAEVIRALYRASKAGVKIQLNIRGICCLRPGVAGVSENIHVRSIVDRYLEHSRIYYFRNGGHEEVYLSSADWMNRNLSGRLEILFPVGDPNHRRRLIRILETFFGDNQKAWRLLSENGEYERVAKKGRKVRAQQQFHEEAVDSARAAARAAPQFRPLTRPKE
ncbi:MAG: polyphosphate kinase 1 [Pirellulales bacterium]|nr:polyphosphate kinase 1 [Pirellulales bacterium]